MLCKLAVGDKHVGAEIDRSADTLVKLDGLEIGEEIGDKIPSAGEISDKVNEYIPSVGEIEQELDKVLPTEGEILNKVEEVAESLDEKLKESAESFVESVN